MSETDNRLDLIFFLGIRFKEVQRLEEDDAMRVAHKVGAADSEIWSAAVTWSQLGMLPDAPNIGGHTPNALGQRFPPSVVFTALMALRSDYQRAMSTLENRSTQEVEFRLDPVMPGSAGGPAVDPYGPFPATCKTWEGALEFVGPIARRADIDMSSGSTVYNSAQRLVTDYLALTAHVSSILNYTVRSGVSQAITWTADLDGMGVAIYSGASELARMKRLEAAAVTALSELLTAPMDNPRAYGLALAAGMKLLTSELAPDATAGATWG